MYNDEDDFNPEKMGERYRNRGERAGEEGEDEELNPEARRWEEAMAADDVPDFAGEWGYGPARPAAAEANPAPSAEVDGGGELSGANQLTSFGLDTASRLYGVNAVIKTILDVDETGSDSDNPLGAIYERLAPTPEQRSLLYQEINKDRAQGGEHNGNGQESLVGMDAAGDFYDKTSELGRQASAEAIQAFRRLVAMLETSEKFAGVRERAAEQGKTVVEYLIGDEDSATLTDFFNRIGEVSESEVEELVEELEEEVNPEVKAENAAEELEDGAEDLPGMAGEESGADAEDYLGAASEQLNPEMINPIDFANLTPEERAKLIEQQQAEQELEEDLGMGM